MSSAETSFDKLQGKYDALFLWDQAHWTDLLMHGKYDLVIQRY